MKTENHEFDFCVVGGGLAGLCAAVAAARGGAKVALVQDRPMLGGNASSEVRMWVCGAHGAENKETGIVEEIHLENIYRNPDKNYSLWDTVLYEKAYFQDNLTLFLNCTCCDAVMDANSIKTIKCWQMTAETWHNISAKLFADCSGDSILAPLSGADFRVGREAREEFDEDIEPEEADNKTMGLTCLIQARETDQPQKFIKPSWALDIESLDELPPRSYILKNNNFWWMELGGVYDSIHDTERLRDKLLALSLGVWDYLKRTDKDAENWGLDWLGFLPGKRESRRLMGDHILCQNEVRSEGKFEDMVAFGGWPMDDHHPDGFYHIGKPTIFHPAPSPFGIPYRCLYSRNIENLFFAGRNISTTHAALSSTRVMATCGTLGQAVGTAAAIAVRDNLTPRGVYENRLQELQQTLMDDDCYLPWKAREISALCNNAKLTASEGDPETLRNGFDRCIGEQENSWSCDAEGWACYEFDGEAHVSSARVVFDSDFIGREHDKNSKCAYGLADKKSVVPECMVKSFRIEALQSGVWKTVCREENNYQRLVKMSLDIKAEAIRIVPEKTWGAPKARLFAFDVK